MFPDNSSCPFFRSVPFFRLFLVGYDLFRRFAGGLTGDNPCLVLGQPAIADGQQPDAVRVHTTVSLSASPRWSGFHTSSESNSARDHAERPRSNSLRLP